MNAQLPVVEIVEQHERRPGDVIGADAKLGVDWASWVLRDVFDSILNPVA